MIDEDIYDENCKKIIQKMNKCNNCGSVDIINECFKNYLICNNCGNIIQEYLNEKCEFVFSENGEQNTKSRFGSPYNYFFPIASSGTSIAPKYGYNILCAIQKQGQIPYRERKLMHTLERIQEYKKYGISQSILMTAKILLTKVSNATHKYGNRKNKPVIMRNTGKQAVEAACIYEACRRENKARTPKDIATTIYNIDIKTMTKGRKILIEMGIIDISNPENLIERSWDYITWYAKVLNISHLSDKMIQVLKVIDKINNHNSHEADSTAAGCIFMFSKKYNLKITKEQIAELFKLSEVTIIKWYDEMSNMINLLFNEKFLSELENLSDSESE